MNIKKNGNVTQPATRGFAPLFVILAIVLIGGGVVYAVVPRTVLKEFFQTGDKPTEAQFSNTIDSTANLTDDGALAPQKEYNPTKEYLVGDTVVKSEPIYQAKVLSENQTEFTLDTAQPVTFRWTPVVPKPQDPVTYRLKVWQLMQGQNGSEAMKTNQPIVTKDVADITEATISNIYTGPCRPPYLCDYIWSVEALSQGGADTGSVTNPSASTDGSQGTSH